MSASMDSTTGIWSSYFTRAPGDIWTLLDRAIDHAAEHFPGDFRSRRDAIAERIFAPRQCVKGLPNGALSPIRTRLVEEVGVQHNRTLSALPSSAVQLQALDNVEDRVLALKNELESSPRSADEVLRILADLDNQRLSMNILRSTEIGKTVNGWRKHSSPEVKEAAKRLVKKWKESIMNLNNGAGVASAAEREISMMQRKNSHGPDDMLLSPRAGLLSPGLRLPIDQHNNIGSAESAVIIDDDSDPTVSQHTQDLGQFLEDFLGDETEPPTTTTRTQPANNRMVLHDASNGRGKGTTPQRQRPSSAPGADGSSLTMEDARMRAAATASIPESKEDSDRRLKAARERLHQRYQQAEDAKKQRTLLVLDPGSLPPQAKHRKVARR